MLLWIWEIPKSIFIKVALMKNRYLFTFTLFFIAGILISTSVSIGFYLPKILAVLFVIMSVICVATYKKFMPLIITLALISGFAAGSTAENTDARHLSKYDGQSVSGRLIITEITKKEYYSYGTAKITSINGEKVNEKISLFISGTKNFFVNDTAEFENLKLSLTGIPGEGLNDGAFDYVLYNRSHGIFYEGSVKGDDMKSVEDFSFSPFMLARSIKTAVTSRISDVFSNTDHAGILSGLFVGDKSLISDETYGYFKLAGISHILCVSGMHVMLIMSIIELLLSLARLSRRKRKIISLILICAFIAVTGMSSSSIRAGAMVIAATCASFGSREYDSATALAGAVLIMLMINPLTVYDPSFQLSASATLGIISLNKTIKKKLKFLPDVLSDGISLTVSAQLGSLPVMIISFGYVSAVSVIANIAVVTFLPVVYLVGVLAVVSGFYPATLICGYMLDIVTAVAKGVSKIPFGIIDLPPFAFVVAGATILTLTLILGGLKVHKSKRIVAVFAALGIIIMVTGGIAEILPSGMLEAYFINVDQGDCCLMRMPDGRYILIDTGTEKKCENEVIPYLKRKGVKKLDALILSHSHEDHAGGASLIANTFNTSRIIYPYADSYEFKDLKTDMHSPAAKGDTFSFGDCVISILSPDRSFITDDKNEYSMIFRVDYGESSYLFTGDAEEDTLENVYGLDTDVLKVPHHGSKNGLSKTLVSSISPEISVISVGRNNRYGHPHDQTLDLLENSGSYIYRTDKHGMIKLKSKKDGIFIK